MSILSAEFDINVAKREWTEEGREDKALEIAKEMLIDGEPIEKIARWTKLSLDDISQLM